MNSKNSAPVSPLSFPLAPVAIGMCFFILAAGAGLLALSSCSSSPEAIAREDGVIQTLSNAVDTLRQAAPYTPAPANSLIEPVLALCSAGLAIWSGYLHRSVRVLIRNANGNGSSPAPANANGSGNIPLNAPAPPSAQDLAARLAATRPKQE
jgi:hypothetical protein